MMTRPVSETNNNKRICRAARPSTGSALIIALLTAAAPAALAQQAPGLPSAQRPAAAKTPIEPTLRSIPAAAKPVFDRAADTLRFAESGLSRAPADARQSYRTAAQDLRQMLALAGYSPRVTAPDGSEAADLTTGAIRFDVRTLRTAAYRSSSPQDAALLKRAANLYEAAGQSLTEARQREAMNRPDPAATAALNRAARANAARRSTTATAAAASGGYSQVASNSLPPARHRGPAVSVRVYGSHQDQVQARQQGMQALRDLYAPPATTAATAADTANEAAANESAAAAALAAQASAYNEAYQQAAAQQAYLNALGLGPGITLGPNGSLFSSYPAGVYGYGGYPLSSAPFVGVTPANPGFPYGGMIAPPTTFFQNPFGPPITLPGPVTVSPLPGLFNP